MAEYSIKDLEKLSGIKAHTLRIWEKRHGLLQPQRTDTNIRYYNDLDLKRLLNVSILNEQGIKISKIAAMTSIQVEDMVKELSSSLKSERYYVDRLIMAMVDLDEDRFLELLNEVTLKMGFEDLVVKVLYGFLDQIGILWLTGNINPAQEHFVSNLIRQKLLVAIDGLGKVQNENAPKFLMFLPEKEMHELALLFYQYLVKKTGFKAYYLGQCVPAKDVLVTMDTLNPEYLVGVMVTPQFPDGGKEFFSICESKSSCKKIFLTGAATDEKRLSSKKLKVFQDAVEFKAILSTL